MSCTSYEQNYLDHAKRHLFNKYALGNRGHLDETFFSKALRDLLGGINYRYSKEEYNAILSEAFQLYDGNNDGIIEYEDFTLMIDFFILEQGFQLSDISIDLTS